MSSPDAVTRYLQEELRKAEKRFQILLVAMGIVLVVVVGYFQWIKAETAELTKPETIGEFMINEVRRGLPAASEAMKQGLREQAPDVVRYIVQHVVDGVFPIVRDGVEEGLKAYADELVGYGTDGLMVAYGEILRNYKQELGEGTEAEADALAMRMSDALQTELEKEPEDGSESLQDKLDASAVALQRINKQLKDLAGRRTLTREEELGKRLITTWWTYLERNRDELPGAMLDRQDGHKQHGVGKGDK